MLGAGVFVVFAPAAALAGPLLTLAVAVAGVIAYCNAVASASWRPNTPPAAAPMCMDAGSSASGPASLRAGVS